MPNEITVQIHFGWSDIISGSSFTFTIMYNSIRLYFALYTEFAENLSLIDGLPGNADCISNHTYQANRITVKLFAIPAKSTAISMDGINACHVYTLAVWSVENAYSMWFSYNSVLFPAISLYWSVCTRLMISNLMLSYECVGISWTVLEFPVFRHFAAIEQWAIISL